MSGIDVVNAHPKNSIMPRSMSMTSLRRVRRSSDASCQVQPMSEPYFDVDPANDELSTTCTSKPLKSCLSTTNLEVMGNGSSHHLRQLRIKRNVSFHAIAIREHPVALGDHPGVSCGPALTLDWYDPAVGTTIEVPLEDYESARTQPPRHRRQLVMPREIRESILRRDAGVTNKELQRAIKDANKIKASRRSNAKEATTAADKMVRGMQKALKSVRIQTSTSNTAAETAVLMERARLVEQHRQQQLAFFGSGGGGGYASESDLVSMVCATRGSSLRTMARCVSSPELPKECDKNSGSSGLLDPEIIAVTTVSCDSKAPTLPTRKSSPPPIEPALPSFLPSPVHENQPDQDVEEESLEF